MFSGSENPIVSETVMLNSHMAGYYHIESGKEADEFFLNQLTSEHQVYLVPKGL